MKEKFEDIRSVLGDINEEISFKDEERFHELIDSIIELLDELEDISVEET